MAKDIRESTIAIHIHLALYRLGYDEENNIMAIYDYLYSTDEFLINRALWAAGEIGPDAEFMLPRIEELASKYSGSDIIYGWSRVIGEIQGYESN